MAASARVSGFGTEIAAFPQKPGSFRLERKEISSHVGFVHEHADVSIFHNGSGAGASTFVIQVERGDAGSSDPENHDMTHEVFGEILPAAEPERNNLLAQLSLADKKRVYPQLELVELKVGAVVYKADAKITHAYFPVDCLLSAVHEMEDGDTAGVALTGSDGFTGMSMLLSDGIPCTWTVVQNTGHAYRMRAEAFKSEFNSNQNLHDLLLRYVQIQLVESSQLAACNCHHWVEQRLCGWLLRSADRLKCDTIAVTQQLIADMLGVRREGVCLTAANLQALGLIACRRGAITIVDRGGIEERTCECYGVVVRESDRLLHQHSYESRAG